MVTEMSGRGNVLMGKCSVGEVSVGEVSGRGIIRSQKCPSEKCPSGKCQSGICPRGSVSRGNVQSEKCPYTKTEALYAELKERVKATTSGYSATGDMLLYIYSVLVKIINASIDYILSSKRFDEPLFK